MNKEQALFIALFGMMFLFVLMIIGLNILSSYLMYINYYNEGYEVKFDIFGGCEILMDNVNQLNTWESCYNIGDSFSVKNFAVRRGK